MEQKEEFVLRALQPRVNFSDLCRESAPTSSSMPAPRGAAFTASVVLSNVGASTIVRSGSDGDWVIDIDYVTAHALDDQGSLCALTPGDLSVTCDAGGSCTCPRAARPMAGEEPVWPLVTSACAKAGVAMVGCDDVGAGPAYYSSLE